MSNRMILYRPPEIYEITQEMAEHGAFVGSQGRKFELEVLLYKKSMKVRDPDTLASDVCC